MSQNIKVREIIRHGNYRNERIVEVYALTPLTVGGILQSSAYCYTAWDDDLLGGVLAALKAGAVAQYGWSDFQVID